MVREERTASRKKRFLEELDKSLGVIRVACKNTGISRTAYYKWLAKDERFKEQVRIVEENTIDVVEGKLMDAILKGNTYATIFYLKTKGKNRGYYEKQDVNVTDNSYIDALKALSEKYHKEDEQKDG